jgi:hypothetical protein
MPQSALMPLPKQNFSTILGTPLVGGKVYTYDAGTTNPRQTFSDQAGTIPQANPIVLNVRGEPASAIYWNGNYRVDIYDALNNLIYSVDNFNADPYGAFTIRTDLADTSSVSLGAAMIGRGVQIVNEVGEIRGLLKTSPSKYAIVDGPSTISANGSGTYYRDDADNTSVDDNFFVIVATDGGRWKRQRLVWQTATSGADAPTWQIARNTSHVGGSPGTVVNALNISATIGASVTNFEWAFLSQLDNSATAGENVAIYGQAKKRAQGSTWAGCLEIQDIYTADPAVGSCIGLELACSANGGDTGFQRNGVHVAMGKLLPGGTTCEWGNGFRATAGTDSRFANAFVNEGPFRLAAFSNTGDSSALVNSATFKDTGKAGRGLDLSGATYTGSAIQLATTQILAFEATAAVKLYASGGLLVCPARLSLGDAFAVSSAGGTSATAGAPTGRYLNFYEDGVLRKLAILAA